MMWARGSPARQRLTFTASLLLAGALAITASGCGSHGSTQLAPAVQAQLPLDLGDLNDLCTKDVHSWRDPRFQRTRRLRLRQADALIIQLRSHPQAHIGARFTDADSGKHVIQHMTLLQLAREQLHEYDGAHYCERPDTATPKAAAALALERIAELRRLTATRSSG